MDKQIMYDCPHISLTDWGTYACKLYNPRDKNCIVSGGNCASNTNCPYKQNFEKDIAVPSKSKIMYDYNAKDCEQCNPDSVCCYCKNIACYKLEEQLKAENEELKTGLKQIQKQFGIEILYCKTTGESTFRSTAILKLEKALTEIREIAGPFCNACQEFEPEKKGRNCMYCNYGKILQKISEVEDGSN